MQLDKIESKSHSYPLVYNKESMAIMDEINTSYDVKRFLKKILKDYEILNVLCNHYSTLSVVEEQNFPLIFDIYSKSESEIEDHFDEIAEDEKLKVDHTISEITKKAKPFVLDLIKKYPKYFKGIKLEIIRKITTGKGLEAFNLIIKNLPEKKRAKLFKKMMDLASGDLVPG